MNTMTRSMTVALALITTVAVSCYSHAIATSAQPAVSPSPADTAARFFVAVNDGRIDDAVQLTASFAEVPADLVARMLQDQKELLADLPDGARTKPRVVGHLQVGDAAIVLFDDHSPQKRRIDLDPAYLIRRGDVWYMLPGVSTFDRKQFALAEATHSRFEKLEEWYKAQKPAIGSMFASE